VGAWIETALLQVLLPE